jgi:GDSL-like Lipase/Acylhydrolase family
MPLPRRGVGNCRGANGLQRCRVVKQGTRRPLARAVAQNLGLLLVSAAVALAAAELFLRRYLPMEGFLYRLHPRYHYTLAPNTRRLFVHRPRNGGGLVRVTVNSDGFRGDELGRGPHPRIVVYGDSCIEADYSRLAETFTKRLEARLSAAAGSRVETINAGVNGYGPDQALRRFQDEAERLRPTGIVFTMFADNDFGDLIRNRLYRTEGDLAVEAGGVLVEPLRQMFDPSAQNQDLELHKRLRHAFRRSRRRHRLTPEAREEQRKAALADYLRASVEMCQREFEEIVLRRNPLISDLIKDHYDADVSFFPDSAAATYKRALLEAVLRQLHTTAVRENVRVLVLVIPSPIDICDVCEVPVDPKEHPGYDRRRLATAATGAARGAELDVLNLFEPFREAGADGLYYRHGEDHWNAAGQDLAARLASERILAEGWLGALPARRDPPGGRRRP